MSTSPSLIAVLLPLMVAIVAGIVIRRYGRRAATPVNPRCRRCGYDVSQRPAGVERCSECGADLTATHSVVTVQRDRNVWSLVLGWTVLVVSLLIGAQQTARFAWQQWYLHNAPLSWIIARARADHSVAGNRYVAAWRDRDPSAAFYDHLLDLQADPAFPWTFPLTLLPNAFEGKTLTAAQSERYLKQWLGGPTAFVVRDPVRAGDPLPIQLNTPKRGGGSGRSDGRLVKGVIAVAIDGVPVVDERKNWAVPDTSDQSQRTLRAAEWGGDRVAPGKHRLTITRRRGFVDPSDPFAPVSHGCDVTATVDLAVLPADAPIGQPIADASKANETARSVDVAAYHWHDGRCFAMVRLLPADVDRAFSVEAVLDGKRQRIGGVAASARQFSSGDPVFYVPLPVEKVKQLASLTLVLEGDGQPLAETIYQRGFWQGRIVFADVPLQSFDDYVAATSRAAWPTTRPFRIEPPTTQPATSPSTRQ